MTFQCWQIRSNARVLFIATAVDFLDLAAAIHRRLNLSDGMQVRLQLNQHDLSPTGTGWVCRADGIPQLTFQAVRMGDTTDRLVA